MIVNEISLGIENRIPKNIQTLAFQRDFYSQWDFLWFLFSFLEEIIYFHIHPSGFSPINLYSNRERIPKDEIMWKEIVSSMKTLFEKEQHLQLHILIGGF